MDNQVWDSIFGLAAVIALMLAVSLYALRRVRQRRRQAYVAHPEAKQQPAPAPLPEPGSSVPPPVVHPDAAPDAAPDAQAPATRATDPQMDLPLTRHQEVLQPPPQAPPQLDLVLRAGLKKTQEGFLARINALFSRSTKVDPQLLDALEEILLTSDVGVGLTTRLLDTLRARQDLQGPEAVRASLRQQIYEVFARPVSGPKNALQDVTTKPKVILFVGVNGVGKTTTIGKMAAQLRDQGRRVLLAAGDTFRAAAADQLEIWAQRSGAALWRGAHRSDPASVVFGAVQKAVEENFDIVLADTAGRLHTKVDLMDEIKKVQRAAGKARHAAPDETWLVLDATTGQNALQQAREFNEVLGLSGLVLTKLDGTAKGGVVVAVVDTLAIPVRFVGVGEQIEDLRAFEPQAFVDALFDNARAA